MIIPIRRPDPLQPLQDVIETMALEGNVRRGAEMLDAALRSAIRASVAGRQQKKNLDPLMDTARKAFIRSLRRAARPYLLS